MEKIVPIEISARHVHLSRADLEALFGSGYELKKRKDLTQPSDFAAEETIGLKAGENKIGDVRIVGPLRPETQVELSLTDAFNLGINPPFKNSGDLEGSPGITLIGSNGELNIQKGVIIPLRHIHCNPKEAKTLKLKNGIKVSVKVAGERATIFENIAIRIGENYKLCLHLDTDEGNTAGIDKKGEGEIVM